MVGWFGCLGLNIPGCSAFDGFLAGVFSLRIFSLAVLVLELLYWGFIIQFVDFRVFGLNSDSHCGWVSQLISCALRTSIYTCIFWIKCCLLCLNVMTHFGGSRDAGVRHMRLSMRCAHVRFSVFSWSNQLRTWKLSGDCSRWPVCAWALEHQIIRYNYLTSQSPRKVLYRIFWYILGVQECGQGLYDPLHCPLFLIEERPLNQIGWSWSWPHSGHMGRLKSDMQTYPKWEPASKPVSDSSL